MNWPSACPRRRDYCPGPDTVRAKASTLSTDQCPEAYAWRNLGKK